jgi:hypothetical protein
MLPLNPAQCTLGNEGLDEYQFASANRDPLRGSRWLSLSVETVEKVSFARF